MNKRLKDAIESEREFETDEETKQATALAKDENDLFVNKDYMAEVFKKNGKLLPCDLTSDENVTGSEDQEQLEKEELNFI